MRRVVARYETEEDADALEDELRDAALEPERPEFDNQFFDPSADPPEKRGLLWGGLIGGVIGAAIVMAMAVDLIWIPRLSPIISAGRLSLFTFGFGIGVAVGGFVGGIWGTLKEIPEPDEVRVAVEVSDARVGEIAERMRSYNATTVDEAVTTHDGTQ